VGGWVSGGLGLDTFIVVRNAISCQCHVLVASVSFRLYFAGYLKMVMLRLPSMAILQYYLCHWMWAVPLKNITATINAFCIQSVELQNKLKKRIVSLLTANTSSWVHFCWTVLFNITIKVISDLSVITLSFIAAFMIFSLLSFFNILTPNFWMVV